MKNFMKEHRRRCREIVWYRRGVLLLTAVIAPAIALVLVVKEYFALLLQFYCEDFGYGWKRY